MNPSCLKRRLAATPILLSACLLFMGFGQVASSAAQEDQKPTVAEGLPIAYYENTPPMSIGKQTIRVKNVIKCEFFDPTKDKWFMKSFERVTDSVTRQRIRNNHYGVLLRVNVPDHPMGSDTVFYPTRNPSACETLSGIRDQTLHVHDIMCMGDHYPPCWFGITGIITDDLIDIQIKDSGCVIGP